ncbi:cytochrome P450 family protein [Alicyclobacillus suci]|uniref:cytochrome P450 family protein n=1 Tax=Alicyclobacillus suci TaxID=2816080 RepID=UPI001F15E133|nr:cytochrome P450 [Alicyclobacillus suci]
MNTSDQNNTPFSLFDVESGEMVSNLFPLFARMRSVGPVVRVPFPVGGRALEAWLVVRMEEAQQVLKDKNHFVVNPASINGGHFDKLTAIANKDESAPETFVSGNALPFIDDPAHRRLRGLVAKAFTPKYVEGLRPRVQEIADELLDKVQDQGGMDVVKDYAYPLPINVISEMLGVPHSDREQLHVWSAALARGLGVARQDLEVVEHLRAFGEYTAQLVADKRLHPANDLISQLIASEAEGDRLSESELISMITLLIFAGHETTSNLISIGTLMLLDHPDQLEKLKADLSLVPSAVEELLRFNGPSTIVGPRYATEDLELGGQHIKKGDLVIPVVKSANRDEYQFEHSEELDITRKINRHLAFGHGVHMCLGAPLARLEGDIAFTTLLKRLPNIRLSVPRDSLTWSSTLTTQNVNSLPVTF